MSDSNGLMDVLGNPRNFLKRLLKKILNRVNMGEGY